MPIVTAAGYPTQSAPSVAPSPTAGNDYQNIPSSPDAFGAGVGRAQSHLGATFGETGNEFAAVALEQQRLTNQVAADNSTNYIMDQAQKLLHGDPDKPGDVGYYGLQGNDAINARQSTSKTLDDLVNSARSKLTNPRQQVEFDRQTARMRNYWSGQIGTHYDQQLKTAALTAANSRIALAEQGQAVTAAAQDETGFTLHVQNEMEAIQQKARQIGAGPEYIDAEFMKTRAKATKQWAESMSIKDPLGADQFLEHNKDALLPGEYRQLKTEFRGRAEKQQASEDVYGKPAGSRGTYPNMIQGGAIKTRIGDMSVEQTLDTISHYESPEGNVRNYKFDARHTAQGHFQITNTTWRQFAPEAGVDTGQFPNAMAAPYDIQRQVARTILTSPNGGGIQHWADFNSELARALKRDETTIGNGTPFTDDQLKAQFVSWQKGIKSLQPDQVNTSFDAWKGMMYPGSSTRTLAQASGAKPPDTLIDRPLPPREEIELPDVQVPGLAQKIQDLAKRIPQDDPDRFARAIKLLRQDANRDYADQQHQYRLHQEQIKAQDEAQMAQYQRRMTANNPQYPTTNEVLSDTKLSPEAQRTMVGFIERQTRADPAAEVSKKTTVDLYRRMNLPYGDEQKISTEKQIDDAYTSVPPQLTQHDHDWLVNNMRKQRTDTDEVLKDKTSRWIKAAEPRILGPSYGGVGDIISPERHARYQEYIDAVHKKIEKWKTDGKDPSDLFDRNKPESINSNEFIKQFEPPVHEAVRPPTSTLKLDTADAVIAAQKANRIGYDYAQKLLTEKFGYQLRPPAQVEHPVPVR